MQRAQQVTSLAFLALAVLVIVQGQGLPYFVRTVPGPGFFPIWVGILLGALSLVWFGQVSLRRSGTEDEGFVPDRPGLVRIASVLVALVLFVFLLAPIGFNLAMFGLLLFLLLLLGRRRLVLKGVMSIAGSFGAHYLFEQWLRVPLPYASMEFLRGLGF